MGVFSGMSTTTWSSDLSSKGSILRTTAWKTGSRATSRVSPTTPPASSQRRLRLSPRNGVNMAENRRCRRGLIPSVDFSACSPEPSSVPLPRQSRRTASQGASTKATTCESTMPAEALMGIGPM